jgi:hypothetical protein
MIAEKHIQNKQNSEEEKHSNNKVKKGPQYDHQTGAEAHVIEINAGPPENWPDYPTVSQHCSDDHKACHEQDESMQFRIHEILEILLKEDEKQNGGKDDKKNYPEPGPGIRIAAVVFRFFAPGEIFPILVFESIQSGIMWRRLFLRRSFRQVSIDERFGAAQVLILRGRGGVMIRTGMVKVDQFVSIW